jgi:hypothetical protein
MSVELVEDVRQEQTCADFAKTACKSIEIGTTCASKNARQISAVMSRDKYVLGGRRRRSTINGETGG